MHRWRHEHICRKDGEIVDSSFPGGKNGAGDGWRGGFEANREKYHLFIGICGGNFE